jgi:hypothetical protein
MMLALLQCRTQKSDSEQRGSVGDIVFDPNIDDPNFALCGTEEQLFQYFNSGKGIEIEGEKKGLDKQLFALFKNTKFKNDGYVRIRFIVNCKGESGRFRVLTSDLQFREMKMHSSTTEPLLKACKDIKGWKPLVYNDMARDYYQYLTFKLVDGKLKEILP